MIISIRGIYEGLFSTHSAAEEKASETEIQFYREGFECQLTTGAFIILTIIILYIYYHVPDTSLFLLPRVHTLTNNQTIHGNHHFCLSTLTLLKLL